MSIEAINYTSDQLRNAAPQATGDAKIFDLTAQRGPEHPVILWTTPNGTTYSETGSDGKWKTPTDLVNKRVGTNVERWTKNAATEEPRK